MTLDEIFQQYVNKDYEELVSLAQQSLPDVISGLKKVSKNDKEAIGYLFQIIGSIICVDGVVNNAEHKLYCDMLGNYVPYEDFYQAIKNCNSSGLRNAVNNFVDAIGNQISSDTKAAIVLLCLCFGCIDEKLTADEQNYLKLLLK